MITINRVNVNVGEQVLAQFSEEALTQVLSDIAESVRKKWKDLAGKRLYTSRRDYVRGIQPVELAHLRATITLVGVVANLVENGMPETDLRDTLLGPNVPVAPFGLPGKRQGSEHEGHYYRAIPFRHATPGTTGAVGVAMGRAYQEQLGEGAAKRLGREVYAAAKQLGEDGGGTRTAPYRGTAYGARLPEGLAPKLREHHVTDIYAGMIRQEKVYEKKQQASYVTFRTISTEKREGWIRPATDGVKLGAEVAQFAIRIAEQSFAQYVEGLQG